MAGTKGCAKQCFNSCGLLVLSRSNGRKQSHMREVQALIFRTSSRLLSLERAVVVMMTPDDEAKLKDEFIKKDDPRHEKRLTGQARPNVLFEAGMAFGTHPRQTVLVEFGKLRPISDLLGRHTVRMDGSTAKRQELMIKLQSAGCQVDFVGTDWQNDGDFAL
jgi:predicted nucleotide-binding protein